MNQVTIYTAKLTYKHWELLLAATEKGLCYVGTDHATDEDLKQTCIKQFKHCKFIEDDSKLSPYIKQLIEYFDGTREEFTIPFDFHGTPFQLSIWNALLEIPYGQTVTYSDIAERIHNKKAIRAVGTAIGANPISIIIPCHRVIGKNGTLTGYSGGLDVKEKLLVHEGFLLF